MIFDKILEYSDYIAKILGTIAILNLIAIIVQLSKELSVVRGDKNKKIKWVFFGVLGGLFGIYGTIAGVPLESADGALVSVRDVGPMMAGFCAGPIGGLLAGIIAGTYRIVIDMSKGLEGFLNGSAIPCGISTMIIGVISGIIYKFVHIKKRKALFAFIIAMLLQMLHLTIFFFYLSFRHDFVYGFDKFKAVSLPFMLANGLAFAILVYVIGIANRIRSDEYNAKLTETELQTATNIQASMLPVILPTFPGRSEFSINAFMEPAKEVGGDFYDLFFIDDDHFAFLVGDVSGKGVPSALFMAISKTLLKNSIQLGIPLADAVMKTNNQLNETNKEQMFVTMWVGVLEISTNTLKYVNAGHNPPLIKHANGTYDYVRDRSGFVLGGMPGLKYKEFSKHLEPGDKIFVYSDGVTEAMNSENAQYGEERLKSTLDSFHDAMLTSDVIKNIYDDILEFTNGFEQSDDITMISLSIEGIYDSIKVEVSDSSYDLLLNRLNSKLKDFNVSERIIKQFDISYDEIYSNIAKYSKSPDVEMGITYVGNNISVSFKYGGEMFDPTKTEEPDITLKAEDRQIGGLGLFMVKQMMDSLQYKYINDKNLLVLYKTTNNREE